MVLIDAFSFSLFIVQLGKALEMFHVERIRVRKVIFS
jgi:hypothetical protein